VPFLGCRGSLFQSAHPADFAHEFGRKLNDDAPTADDATIYPLQGGKAALDACQRLGVFNDYQLDPGRAEQAV
jgi:hypothetical protein